MSMEFYKVVEEIKGLGYEDKIYLKELCEKMIISEKRKLIKKHGIESMKEYKEKKIKFGSAKDLKKALYES